VCWRSERIPTGCFGRPQHRDEVASTLQAYRAMLVGEPFQFARVSYGDELTLHFGDLRPARSAKLKGKPYGAFILGVRGSAWIIKSGAFPLVLTAGVALERIPPELGHPLSKEVLEAQPFITPGSRVISATPFDIKTVAGFGLQVALSDGSSLVVIPTMQGPEQPGDESLPELADWEVLSPYRILKAGPGLSWSFEQVWGEAKPRPAE